MTLHTLYERITTAPFFEDVRTWIEHAGSHPRGLHVRGTAGSLPAFLLTWLYRSLDRPLLCIQGDAEEASYLYSDLEQFAGESGRLLLYPPSAQKPYDAEQVHDPAPLIARADVLQQLADGFRGVLVTSIEALVERVPPTDTIRKETLTVRIGDELPPETLIERLVAQRFERVEFVGQPGELARRGGIIDIYPFTGAYPIRLEFFGDELDSIREFEADSQRSISRLTEARLVPNLEAAPLAASAAAYTSLFDALPPDVLLAPFDAGRFAELADTFLAHAEEAYVRAREHDPDAALLPPSALFLDGPALTDALLARQRIHFGPFVTDPDAGVVHADAYPQPAFNSSMGPLRKRLSELDARGLEAVILCDSRGQEGRLYELLEDVVERGSLSLVVESLHRGFELPSVGLALYTDHEIFNRYHRPTSRRQKRRLGGLSLRELRNLSPGDFVVHIDYGIGKFAGLEQIIVRGKQQEAVRVLFQGDDVLYVNVNALYKLHKYTGKEGHQPRLTKLGSGQWERAKSRTKKRVKEIARDLIALYARRKASRGFAFSNDSIWQRELEASFQYEDTPDQSASAESVKRDMEQPVPMDRLVCGDVGFGKTEIAVRAAFKAAQDGKQVAVLVPTTILASQHFETFNNRLQPYPITVSVLSRFRSAADQKVTLDRLAAGQVDIVIGTHRLLSKDVRFKDLGLLIIDEEQRFGVAAKEKLRTLRAEVDTLALTATPIPRTLQFSLLGARDLSIINTPPPNRQPIVTEIHSFDQDLIRDAILYEVNRGGQVFFIHNRVQSIEEMARTLRLLVPDVRMRVAHGQMKPAQLEKVMLDFIHRKFDVLISTNIVESGLDISNANTIIINRAERFGLSDLHQLRGRVGRSNQKAFCYLLVPSIRGLTREARQRLQAVEEFSELGSGFNIAMRDLDIRGAGSLLGAQQSGFIEEVGYETYHKILDESVQELRAEEFSDVFTDAPPPPPSETVVDVEEDAYIPEAYLANGVERLNLYRKISEADTPEQLTALRGEMMDRFGLPPAPVDHLLAAAEMRFLGQSLRLPRVVYKNQRLFLDIPQQAEDAYFYETLFHPLLERLSRLKHRYVMKETRGGKLRAIIQDVPTMDVAQRLMEAVALPTPVPVPVRAEP